MAPLRQLDAVVEVMIVAYDGLRMGLWNERGLLKWLDGTED